MRRLSLRHRLNIALLQWFGVLAVATGGVLFYALTSARQNLIDERLLLARTLAHAVDGTLSASLQSLGRLADDLPTVDADAGPRLRAFRFQSPFREAAYLLDGDGRVLAADPVEAGPPPAILLSPHEVVTPVVSRPDAALQVAAAVHPFRRGASEYYLVAEMSPLTATFSTVLRDLASDREMHVVVVDEHGVVVASPDHHQVLATLPGGDAYGDRLAAKRPLIATDLPCEFVSADHPTSPVLTVMAPLQFARWGVVIQQHHSGLDALWRLLLVGGVFITGLAMVLARTLSRSVVSPIQRLSRQAETMRGGDLRQPVAVTGDLEIEVLARTLDEARARLAATLEELQALNAGLEAQVAARTKTIVEQDEQRRVLLRRLLRATEEERRRLARELHDEISQLLTVVQLSLHRTGVESPEMMRATTLLAKTQHEMHRIIHDLRPTLLDDLGLAAAMKAYAHEHLERHGIAVSLEIDERLPARPELEIAVFRIYQELLTNILRHARAETVSVEFYERDGRLVLAVEDDGVGFDPEDKHAGAGITGMRERAALVNGTIRFDSEPGMGTHVVVEIPIP